MSGNTPDVIEAIRKIAKTDPDIQRGLAAAKQKAPIPTARGVAYRNADGDIRSGSDVPGDAATSGSSDGTGSKKLGDDQHNVGDVMDLPTGSKVGELDAVDCATGDKIKIDLFPADGAEYPAPDGWSDPDTPPVPEGFLEGYYLTHTSRAGNSIIAVLSQIYPRAYGNGRKAEYDSHIIEDQSNSGGAYGYGYIHLTVNIKVYCDGTSQHYCTYDGEYLHDAVDEVVILQRRLCGSSTESYCTSSPVTNEWPSNNQIDLALIGGKFTAHSMDPDAPNVYKDAPPSALEICDGDGNRFQVRPRHNGGVQVTELNPDGTTKDPGNTKLIDRDGIVEDTIDSKFRQYHI